MAEAPHSRSDATAERDELTDDAVADATLLQAVTDRSPGALDAFYDRFARRAYGLSRRICVDETLAEDVVQEVFLQVWRRPERFDPSRGSVATWFMTMVHHRAVDAVRRESTRRRHTVPAAEEGDEWNAQDASAAGPGADEAALDRVVAGHVRDALTQLPPDQRRALALAYFGGFTQREVASITEVPLGTVKSRMFTAVRTLRGLLDGRVDRGEGSA
ncbi:sigma-70 family RNA polymerase sigma factor [Actinomycetospora sp. OC33-EN08]|uniref:Sigma-70 family RNA polymerase sigma factor n=1 Tax=Actinomycetospora aurantiaca TaxID=3129233 RepID=A0ABU8MUJ4_9PSEU